jgi:3-oxoacyl-[acyl-carrier-protein] synthase-1
MSEEMNAWWTARRRRAPCGITAVGLATALGVGIEATWPRLMDGDQSRLTVRGDLVPSRRLLVGQVMEPLADVPRSLERYASRNTALALTALTPIEAELREAVRRVGPARVGVVMGSSTSGVDAAERAVEGCLRSGNLPAWFDYAQLEMGSVAEAIAVWLGSAGPAYTVSTACSSGAKAVAAARSLLALGVCDAVVTGGADALCRMTTNGFMALGAVADEPSNPFSVNRRGLTLGEGAAVFLLEPDPAAIQVIGVGETSDAHHMSSPDPTGAGAEHAMRQALDDAGIDARAVAYVNLHGTGTPLNDAMESLAVHRVFGSGVPCSSTKPVVGHTLGASGAVEIAFCWMVLAHRVGDGALLPPHCWDGIADPGLPALHLVANRERAVVRPPVAVLSNSFGFGGNNCAVVLGPGQA